MLTLLFEYYWYKWRPEAQKQRGIPAQNQRNGDVFTSNNHGGEHMPSNGVTSDLNHRRGQVYSLADDGVDNFAASY